MSYASNLQNDDIIRAEKRAFADHLRSAARTPTIAVVRITPHATLYGTRFYNAEAWTYGYAAVALNVAEQVAIVRLLLGRRPDIDWAAAPHQYHLDEAMLRRAPSGGEFGTRPPLHRGFGGKDPVFLPRTTVPHQRTRPEATHA